MMWDRRKKYDKENTVQVSVKLNKKTDAEIIDWLDKQNSKQGVIKEALTKLIPERKDYLKELENGLAWDLKDNMPAINKLYEDDAGGNLNTYAKLLSETRDPLVVNSHSYIAYLRNAFCGDFEDLLREVFKDKIRYIKTNDEGYGFEIGNEVLSMHVDCTNRYGDENGNIGFLILDHKEGSILIEEYIEFLPCAMPVWLHGTINIFAGNRDYYNGKCKSPINGDILGTVSGDLEIFDSKSFYGDNIIIIYNEKPLLN